MTAAVFIAAWAISGITFYEFARRSWNRRWKDNSAPGNDCLPLAYLVAAVGGFTTIGALLAEMSISSTWEDRP